MQPADRTELLAALRCRAEVMTIPELAPSQLYLTQRIANGAFGTVYKAEAENLPDYGTASMGSHQQKMPKKLVAAKYLPQTSDKDR